MTIPLRASGSLAFDFFFSLFFSFHPTHQWKHNSTQCSYMHMHTHPHAHPSGIKGLLWSPYFSDPAHWDGEKAVQRKRRNQASHPSYSYSPLRLPGYGPGKKTPAFLPFNWAYCEGIGAANPHRPVGAGEGAPGACFLILDSSESESLGKANLLLSSSSSAAAAAAAQRGFPSPVRGTPAWRVGLKKHFSERLGHSFLSGCLDLKGKL